MCVCIVLPPGLVTTSNPGTLRESDSINLTCEFSGYLPRDYSIRWVGPISDLTISEQTGNRAAQAGGTNPTSSVISTLTISNVLRDHEGSYMCIMEGANNAVLMSKIQLQVSTIPASSSRKLLILGMHTHEAEGYITWFVRV